MRNQRVLVVSDDVCFIGDFSFPAMGKVRLCGEAIRGDESYTVYATVRLGARHGGQRIKEWFRTYQLIEIKTS